PYGSPVIPWIQGEARRIGVLISNQRYTALPSPYDCQTRNLFNSDSLSPAKSTPLATISQTESPVECYNGDSR
ncbi:hypothetical protein QUF58_13375, partial [Anaerolineales bacterium HSG24]|nr:hypothetical protein [Anaerolineales bacterium HSG24]